MRSRFAAATRRLTDPDGIVWGRVLFEEEDIRREGAVLPRDRFDVVADAVRAAYT